MSAPKDAKPLGTAGWHDKDGKPVDPKTLPKCKCQGCGWRGSVTELLGTDDDETMWCPQCGTASWVYD